MSTSAWIIVGGLFFWILTCLAILDIARKDFSNIGVKAAWAFTSLVPFIGVLVYFIFGYRHGRIKTAPPSDIPRC
jgi:hypothetical protein